MSCRVLRLRPCISPFRQVIRLERNRMTNDSPIKILPSRRSTSFCNLAIVRSAKSARDSAYDAIVDIDRYFDRNEKLTSLRREVKSRSCSS